MELTLNFKFAGIEFLVSACVNDEWELDYVHKVEIYDSVLGDYKLIPLKPKELLEFEKAMQDQLFDAIEEEKNAAKEFAEDLSYEQAREEGWV